LTGFQLLVDLLAIRSISMNS